MGRRWKICCTTANKMIVKIVKKLYNIIEG